MAREKFDLDVFDGGATVDVTISVRFVNGDDPESAAERRMACEEGLACVLQTLRPLIAEANANRLPSGPVAEESPPVIEPTSTRDQ